ncbi:winged helix-turn-helix transcriptional regulator [Streptomyces sp. HNM0575]|nr:winged helix-turn-helix transcriptional regulator [Streptomyces sp. HNM0575]
MLPAEQPPAPPAQHPPIQQPAGAEAVAAETPSAAHAPAHAAPHNGAGGSADAASGGSAGTASGGSAGTAAQAPADPGSGVHVDPERHTAHVDGRQLDLTYLEFELLAHFVANPQRVHTRGHLVGTLWGYSHVGDGRTVDVHIARLRRKLGRYRETIVTVRRVGYKYEPGRAR